MLIRLSIAAVCLSILGVGCHDRSDPITQPPPPGVKFTFPRGSSAGIVNIDLPIPLATEVEYIVPLEESAVAGKKLERLYVEVHATNRTILQTAEIRRSGSKDGAALYKGILGAVHKKGPARVIVTAPRAPGKPRLAEYNVRYE
jgi:hypothetical protein